MATVLSRLEQFYIPITRADPQTRTVEGYCFTTPTVKGDKWNLKRSALERAGRKYMEMPAVRAMHGPVAAGKAVSLQWDEKGCLLRAEIVDDNEWRKVETGVYRGFSIGGRPLVARGHDVDEFEWVETSLVDRPCDPGALFTTQATLARVADTLASADEQETPVYVLPLDASDEAVARALKSFAPQRHGDTEEEETRTAANSPLPAPRLRVSVVNNQDVRSEDEQADQGGQDRRQAGSEVGQDGGYGHVGHSSGREGAGYQGAGSGRVRGDQPARAGSALRDAQAQSATGTGDLEPQRRGGTEEKRGGEAEVGRGQMSDANLSSSSPRLRVSVVNRNDGNDEISRVRVGEEGTHEEATGLAEVQRLQGALSESEEARLQAEGERVRAEEEIERLESETGVLRGEAQGLRGQMALLRGELTALHDEVGVLRSEASTLHSEANALRGETDVLRRQPLTRAVPVQYTALGLPREFAANEALRESALGSLSGAAGRDERRSQLVAQRQSLMTEAEAETDAARRTATVQRLLALEWELGQL